MNIVLNTKFFPDLPLERLAVLARDWGYDGLDICARPGHPVTLDNSDSTLAAVLGCLRDEGLVCPIVTAPVDFTDAGALHAERLYAACAEAGVPRIKLGYWRFGSGDDYWQVLDRAREQLSAFSILSNRYGVQSCYHTHSGTCIGSNCAGIMHLVKGFDPRLVGVYPDFGHMALDGEDVAMGLAMICEFLSIVGIKDGCDVVQSEGKNPSRQPMFVKLGAGSVNWGRALGSLRAMNYSGDLVVHTEYRFTEAIIRQVGYAEEKPADLETFVRADVTFLRRLIEDWIQAEGVCRPE